MVSLKDIALSAGVSVATVSKALRDQDDIGEDTKKRIKEIASKLGYMPNAAAQALKTNQSKNLGVLYKEETGYGLKHEYFAGILQGFKNKAEQLGYDITFINTDDRTDSSMSYLEHCRYRNFDGVVIVCAVFNEPQVIELMDSEIPVVTIDYVYHNCTSVSSDNTNGIFGLVDYAVARGHKKIAYIHGQKHSFVTRERVEAFLERTKEHGLSIPEEYLREAAYKRVDETAVRTRELLELSDAPTCIFYPDDTALIGGLNVIYEKGLKIPEDISVIGYDGSSISELIMPPLTTIKQDTDKIGSEAASRLVRIIKESNNESDDSNESDAGPGHGQQSLSSSTDAMLAAARIGYPHLAGDAQAGGHVYGFGADGTSVWTKSNSSLGKVIERVVVKGTLVEGGSIR